MVSRMHRWNATVKQERQWSCRGTRSRLTRNGSLVGAEVFDEFDALRLLLPELEVPIHAAGDQEIRRLWPTQRAKVNELNHESCVEQAPLDLSRRSGTTCTLRGQLHQ